MCRCAVNKTPGGPRAQEGTRTTGKTRALTHGHLKAVHWGAKNTHLRLRSKHITPNPRIARAPELVTAHVDYHNEYKLHETTNDEYVHGGTYKKCPRRNGKQLTTIDIPFPYLDSPAPLATAASCHSDVFFQASGFLRVQDKGHKTLYTSIECVNVLNYSYSNLSNLASKATEFPF